MHTWSEVQYSPPVHEVIARQVEVAWQVRGPPLINSVHDMKPTTVEQSDTTAQNTKQMAEFWYSSHDLDLPCWHSFAAPQNSSEEHTLVQVEDVWQVFAPPATVSLHTVVPVRDSQSKFDTQYTDIILWSKKRKHLNTYQLPSKYPQRCNILRQCKRL